MGVYKMKFHLQIFSKGLLSPLTKIDRLGPKVRVCSKCKIFDPKVTCMARSDKNKPEKRPPDSKTATHLLKLAIGWSYNMNGIMPQCRHIRSQMIFNQLIRILILLRTN